MDAGAGIAGPVAAADVADRAVEIAGGDPSADVAVDVRLDIRQQEGTSCALASGGVQPTDRKRARVSRPLVGYQSGAFQLQEGGVRPPLLRSRVFFGAIQRGGDERQDGDAGQSECCEGQRRGTTRDRRDLDIARRRPDT